MDGSLGRSVVQLRLPGDRVMNRIDSESEPRRNEDPGPGVGAGPGPENKKVDPWENSPKRQFSA